MADLPSADYVRSVLDYDPETGIFTWKERPWCDFASLRSWKTWNTRYAGATAGGRVSKGYLCVIINGTSSHKLHRLAWLHVHGAWPAAQIDHVNGVKDDNRIANLREASHSENQRNTGLQRNNTSGYKGVGWRKKAGKWRARVWHAGRRAHLGYFDTPEEAKAARDAAAQRFHGEFFHSGAA